MYPEEAKKSSKTGARVAKVLPEENNLQSDRVINQLMFVPPNSNKLKTILLYQGYAAWWVDPHINFTYCPVNTCTITVDRNAASCADLIAFQHRYEPPKIAGPPNQLYLIHFLESPVHTQYIQYPDAFNWTATFM